MLPEETVLQSQRIAEKIALMTAAIAMLAIAQAGQQEQLMNAAHAKLAIFQAVIALA